MPQAMHCFPSNYSKRIFHLNHILFFQLMLLLEAESTECFSIPSKKWNRFQKNTITKYFKKLSYSGIDLNECTLNGHLWQKTSVYIFHLLEIAICKKGSFQSVNLIVFCSCCFNALLTNNKYGFLQCIVTQYNP